MPFAAALMIAALRFYRRFMSPLLPPSCRFVPTCSAFAMGAIRQHGPLRGGWMAILRILRCHPGNAGGWDPVPGCGGRKQDSDGSQDAARLCIDDPCIGSLSGLGSQAREASH